MGRPKKTDAGAASTKERILETAIELIAMKSYDAVSVRDITRAVGLNEASLYNHYPGKMALMEAIFQRMEERLISPAFTRPTREIFSETESFSLADFLQRGGRHFFSRVGRDTRLTWRILMAAQYRFPAAARSMEAHILNAPRQFFTAALETLKEGGKIPSATDCAAMGRIIASVFFDFSFRANLHTAWEEGGADIQNPDLADLDADLATIAAFIENRESR